MEQFRQEHACLQGINIHDENISVDINLHFMIVSKMFFCIIEGLLKKWREVP